MKRVSERERMRERVSACEGGMWMVVVVVVGGVRMARRALRLDVTPCHAVISLAHSLPPHGSVM